MVPYSYYHFHRYFSLVMGETIGSYIRSRRLAQASYELMHTNKRVLDIALSLYFETAESFARAFKKKYGMQLCRAGSRDRDCAATTACRVLFQDEHSGQPLCQNVGQIKCSDYFSVTNSLSQFVHKGSTAGLLLAYRYIWGVWFPESGYALAERDDFERYTDKFLGPLHDESEMEIYFPIQ